MPSLSSRTLLIIAALPLIVSSQAAAEEKGKPFNLNAIGFTADCNPNDTFQRLMTLMVGNGNADPNLYESVSGEIERELHLDNTASWNGLQLSGVHLYFGIERGPANYTLKFDNSATEVRKAWNDLGWNLPNIDDSRDVKELEGYASIGVSKFGDSGQFAQVTCWRD